MARRRHTPDQILAKLRDVDVMLANGKQFSEIAKALEVSEATLHRWRNQFGGMKGEEMKRRVSWSGRMPSSSGWLRIRPWRTGS